MTDDIDKLDGPELSAAVAREVMGWPGHITKQTVWRPHNDRNDAHRVLERCLEIGIAQRVYVLICEQVGQFDFTVATGWGLLTVLPPVVCIAALRAVRASRD